ncbi:MAG: hypothetical protein QF450_00530 [Rhodospirillales bacterium]|nr:hypothetical protein [Rhodospirillales bacterium]
MIPTAGETLRALYGAYRLARLDAGGMAYFDSSIGGFWRSFFAAVLVVPFYALLLVMRYETGVVAAGAGSFAAVEIIAYVIAWVAFPLAMVSVARVLEREECYLGYIVAYNWAAVLQNALYLPIAMIGVAGGMDVGSANAAGLVALFLILGYSWFVARTALAVGAGTAAIVVALDLVLGIVINSVAESML